MNDFPIHNDAPHDIDYIRIDTEGSELEILEDIPFDSWHIRAITKEHNFGDQRARIRELMTSRDYGVTEAKWDDWFWCDDEAWFGGHFRSALVSPFMISRDCPGRRELNRIAMAVGSTYLVRSSV